MLTTSLITGVLLLLYAVLYLYRRRGDATQDMITGLPSRDYFERFLQHCAARAARRNQYGFGVLLLEIRGFAAIRKSHGRFAAEEILADFAYRVFWAIRPTDVLTRLEEDNFAILLEDVRRITDATRVAMRVHTSMTEAMTLASRGVAVAVSVGVTISKPGETVEPRAVIAEAQLALERARESGRPYVVYDAVLDAQSIADAQFEVELMSALDAGQLRLGYQPIIDSGSGALAGFSTVLEWEHPERGRVPARQFLYLAENGREILKIGAWALAQATRAAVAINGVSDRPLLVSVNVGATELQHGDIAGVLETALSADRAVASTMRIEVPAAVFADVDSKLEGLVERLRSLGVGVHVDQAEATSIPLWRTALLHSTGVRLNLSTIENKDPAALLRLIAACRPLVSEILIEGIENAAEYRMMRALEPPVLLQGYFVGRPMGLDEAVAHAARGTSAGPVPR